MRIRKSVVAFLTTLALAALLPATGHGAFPGKNGRIAFTSARDGFPSDADLWTMRPDGTDQTRLTSLPGNEEQATWTADGSRLAFWHEGQGDSSINLINADGTGLRRLLGGNSPSWSPDGSRIVFSCFRLCFATADGTLLADGLPSATSLESPGQPQWSPDGSRIAFTASPGTGSFGLYTMKPDGTDVTRVVSSPATHPEWSPDGSKILYLSVSAVDGFTIVNADGTNPRPLGRGSIFSPWTAWSPDGAKIAFTGSPFSTLWTMTPDGSGAAPLSDSSFYDRMPDWQPVPAPRRSDFKNGPAFCRAERDFLGGAEFDQRYGGGAAAFGKCVSANH